MVGVLAGLATIGIALAYVFAYYVVLPLAERTRYTTDARLAFGVVVLAAVGALELFSALRSPGTLRAGVMTGCATSILTAGVIGAGSYDALALGLWFVGFPALLAAGLAGAAARPHRLAALSMLAGAAVAGAVLWGAFSVAELLGPYRGGLV